jgi:hypothetical protein
VKRELVAKPGHGPFGFLEGARRVRSRRSQHDLARARRDARVVVFPRRSPVERDMLFAHFEGILLQRPSESLDHASCCERHAPLGNALSVELRPGMRGTVTLDTSTAKLALSGSLFSHSYMSARGAGVECMNLRQRIKNAMRAATGVGFPASRWFCVIASAMQRVDGLGVAAPKLDAIFTYRLDEANVGTLVGRDVLEHARRHGLESLAVVDCHLSTGTYMFGVTGHYLHAPYCALMTLLAQCPGQNAWRLRGSIAIDATHALSISRLNGTSTLPLVAGIGTHAVCLVVRVTRDAFGNATRIHLVGRNSYADTELRRSSDSIAHFNAVTTSLRASPLARGAEITAKWHDDRAPAGAAPWETQNAEGSCALHALMLALRIAQDQASDGPKFLEARLNERCPIEFAAVCAAAMRRSARTGPDGASREAAIGLQCVLDVDVPTLGFGIFCSVRCDGSVLCGIKSLSADGSGSAADADAAMRLVELELQRAAEHARMPIHASFLAMSCGRHWERIAGLAKSAGYTRTRASAHKTYTPVEPEH